MKTNLKLILFVVNVLLLSFAYSNNNISIDTVVQWSSIDLSFKSSKEISWREFPLQAVFINNQDTIVLDGFWDGDIDWKVRFAPTKEGYWKYFTVSTDTLMNGLSGSIFCIAPSIDQINKNKNFKGMIKVSSNGHYFTYADGDPVLILTDCQVFGKVNYDNGDFEKIILARKNQGFNGYNVRLCKMSQKAEGEYPYNDYNVEKLNPQYFKNIDKRMKMLWTNGFITHAMPDFLGYGTNRKIYSFKDAQDISRYNLARYATYNFLYTLSGEYENKKRNTELWSKLESWYELGSYVQSINKKAYNIPLSIHPYLGSSSVKFHNQEWLTFNQIQAKVWKEFNVVPFSILDDYSRIPPKPTYYAEGVYENELWANFVGAPVHIRAQTWVPFICGASIVDYGEVNLKTGIFNKTSIDELLNTEGARQVIIAHKFIKNLEWYKMKPSFEDILVNGRHQTFPKDLLSLNSMVFCLSEKGKQHVIYIMGGMEKSRIQLNNLGNKKYITTWLNPRSGEMVNYNSSLYIKNKWILPKRPMPANEDWVMWLKVAE